MKKTYVGYARFSTEAKIRGKDRHEELADTHEIIGEFGDIASGSHGVSDRPALKKLLEDASTCCSAPTLPG